MPTTTSQAVHLTESQHHSKMLDKEISPANFRVWAPNRIELRPDMMTEPTGFAERLAQRKESARRTLRDASTEELRDLVTQLFPDATHPFAEPFSKFIEEHASEKAVRGETSDHISFIYYPRANKGIWYISNDAGVSVGLLGTTSLKELSQITVETGRF